MLAGSPLLLFWQLLAGRVLFWGTPLLQFYVWRELVVTAYRAGHFPLWTHLLGNGAPLLANLQSAALYPPNLLYFLVPVEQAMGYSVVLHVMLAGFLMYGFARSLGLGQAASLIAALSYMLSGFLIGRTHFLSIVSCVPWLPLLFWLTDRVMRRAYLGDALLLGLTIALQLFAGHAQLWYYGLWGIALYALYRGSTLFCELRRGDGVGTAQVRRRVLARWGLMCVAFAVGLSAAAAQLLPTAELAQLSQRSVGADYDFAMNYSFWPWRLLTLVSPDLFGNPAHGDYWGYANYWEDAGYIGLLPLILGLLVPVIWLRRRWRSGSCALDLVPFFAFLSLVSLLLAMGRHLPLYPFVFRHVPGFHFFQAPSRFLYLYTFGMAVLAGIGLQHVTASEQWRKFSRYLIAVSASMLLTLAAARLYLAAVTERSFLRGLTHTAALALGAGVILYLGTRCLSGTRRNVWEICLVVFVAGDLLAFGWPLNPTADVQLYRSPTRTGSFLRSLAEGQEPFRIFSLPRFVYDTMFDEFFRFDDFGSTERGRLRALRETLLPNLPAVEGLSSANNYDPLLVSWYSELIDSIQDREAGPTLLRMLALMNVRYLIDDQPVDGFVPVYSEGVEICENPRFQPRAYVVPTARIAKTWEEALSVLMSDDFDPAGEVVLKMYEPPMDVGEGEQGGEWKGRSRADVSLHYGQNSVTIDALLSQPGYLVLADTYYPSWRAFVNGEERPVLRANYAFRAVALPAGNHHIEFRYAPLSFRIGLWISGVSWLCVPAGYILLRRRSKGPAGGKPSVRRAVQS